MAFRTPLRIPEGMLSSFCEPGARKRAEMEASSALKVEALLAYVVKGLLRAPLCLEKGGAMQGADCEIRDSM